MGKRAGHDGQDTARNKFIWAYRAARVERTINWTPDGVDPDDHPDAFKPGGRYHNSPETMARYCATRHWERGYLGPRPSDETQDAARYAASGSGDRLSRRREGAVARASALARRVEADPSLDLWSMLFADQVKASTYLHGEGY